MSFCKTNNRKLGNFVLIGLIFLFMFTQCQPFDLTPVPKYSYSLEAAQIVSHVTSGLLPTNEKIRVRFTEPVSDALEYGQKIENRYITFSPGIDGDLSWEDSQTLVFTPREALPKRRVYEGIVKVSMFNQFKSSGVSEVKFGFKTEGREIEKIDGDFEFQIQDDPKNLFYRTTVLFTTPVAEEQVREAVKLSCNGKDLKLDISQGSEGREYHISSEVFRRTDERKRLELRVSANPVDISHDYRHEFFLEPVSCFTVTNISVIEQRHTPVIQVSFSDDIDPFQDLNGLVTLAPYRDIKYKVYGSKVYLTGDFAYGENYQIKFSPNIRSRQNNRTSKEFLTNVEIATVKPQMAFLNDGVFLPSGNKYRLRFQTINIRKVHIEVIKVFENNLGQFLQTEQLHSEKSRTYSFNSEYVNRVGVIAANQDLPIGDTKNEWLSHDLDLSKLIKPGEKGLFLIQLSMEREDMIWDQDSSRDQYSYYGDDYYSNPSSNGYLYSHGHIYKPVTVSDIGLTYKQAGATHFIYATDIMSSTPLQGVKVGLRTYQNQLVGQGETDREGRVELRNIKDSVFYVEAERAGQRSMIKLNEMGWNLTTFDIEGYEEPEIGTRAFMFTERGVYRPGDEINLSCIFRNQDSSFPKNHPVTLEFFNPRNQSVYKSTNREGMDGFYNFNFSTKQEDPTGNWKVKVIAGSREFFHTIKVETVVPYRLKVFITSKKDRISITDNSLELNLDSIYLFGNAASNLTAEANITLRNVQKTFPKFKNYTFTNQTVEATDRKTNIFSGNLDEKGHADISWDIPDLSKAPSALEAVIHAKVYERGGRPAEKIEVFPVDPYTHYVGIETPDFDYGYARIGMPLRLNTVCVTASGEPAKGRELEYTLYRNERYWWWEYDDYSQFRYRYKTDTSTQVIKQGRFTSGLTPVAISIQPETWGEYLIEVRDTSDKNGHVAGFFFYASSWGRATPGSKEAATLVLKTDKPSYTVGQVATIKFPRPTEGAVLVSIERGASILKSYWIKLNQSTREDETLTVQITKDMVPTAYVSVSIIQPHAQTVNDRPIRMYGVATLNVKDPATVSSMEIKTSAEFKPSAPFIVEVQTQDRKESQFVIAVVDEGLLDITNFKTPDPWEFFFHKQRLAVMTYDLFSEVIGAQKGDPFKVFSVGGGGEMYDQGMIGAQGKEVRRFKPVSLFKGPITTNATGYAKVSFDMPNYVGSVRIMVIAVKNGQYSSSEKTVPVKTKLMVMPTLPRVLGPDEEFKVPVTVFLMQDNTERVITSIHVEGPIEVVGSMYSDLGVMPKGEKDVMFTLRTKSAAGPVKIKIRAVAGGISTEEETEILIRATSPRAYNSITKRGTPGTQVDFTLPQDGLPGTMEAKINVMRHEFLDFGPRFDWLIHYPYGCIEQTTSSVFPQLYLKKIFTLDPGKERTIDGNINAGISRLRTFQTASGGFGYWPGNSDVHIWGTNYAGHFLLEAKKLGYAVPDDLLANWIRFQKSRALSGNDTVKERVYRVYLLALAGETVLNEMNALRENSYASMDNADKWVLASAYALSGYKDRARELIAKADISIKDYREYGGTYGSPLRDRAMILEAMTVLQVWDRSSDLYEDIAGSISRQEYWYSTQELGYSLLAIGKYLINYGMSVGQQTPVMKGTIILPDGKRVPFFESKLKFEYPITNGFGKQLSIIIDKETSLPVCFLTLEYSGVPLKPAYYEDFSHNLEIGVEYYDEDGTRIDPARLTPGFTFYAIFHARKLDRYKPLEELALVQILPTGWEIDNTRLSGESMPDWLSSRARSLVLNREEYMDIRDDRIMWFFDMKEYNSYTYDFIVRLSTVTEGTFVWPPVIFEAMYDNKYQALQGSDRQKGFRTVVVDKSVIPTRWDGR